MPNFCREKTLRTGFKYRIHSQNYMLIFSIETKKHPVKKKRRIEWHAIIASLDRRIITID